MWTLCVIAYIMLGMVVMVTPLSKIEDSRNYGLLAGSVMWPYMIYRKFKK